MEEGISVIKPLGIMIFNMGGRPGQAVCERLFERRGVRVTKLWQTKILQVSKSNILFKMFLHWKIAPLKMCCHRQLIQIFQPWLKLRRTVHTVLNFLWDFPETSLFVLEQHGHMENLVVVSLMLCQFTVVNFVNQLRSVHQF